MPPRTGDVDRYMAELEHPLKAGIERLRAAILASNDGITEHVKWNAPSFRYAGADRVTFRLQPGDRLQLVLHRGAKVRDDAADFRFDDDSGQLDWVAPDRAVVTFRDLDDVAARQTAVVDVVKRWVAA
ncbi:DUF1801 domain-containing protein [Blastococcus sp. CT_GayMR19]|uniref:DUF1801 domain-containing protein n=1 Tax=Blastococcus sp. CT_GayMR19 TaxID=2559608 RepID=UPI0010743B06|nr:DUF1801 domain-containing protein [Blastococcus sp. CT_GayMR19]TFV73332.1 DUF1801 domain-containing protein [Blastococcus sp. CT_GayMR19]